MKKLGIIVACLMLGVVAYAEDLAVVEPALEVIEVSLEVVIQERIASYKTQLTGEQKKLEQAQFNIVALSQRIAELESLIFEPK